MRASIYCRISADREGAGLGVRTQEQDCRELAATLGASIVTVHTDNDLSAYSGKPRPGYRALLSEIESGAVDAVLAWHTDRLHRSPTELEVYISACEKHSVTTHTVKAGKLDLSTASGLFMARNFGNLARYEVDHARERMHRAKLRSAESGTWKGGRRPFGFEADGVTVRDDEADLLRQAADAILAGDSVRSVARAWNAAGSTTTTGKPWSPHAPRRVLLRPRNAGLMEHRGQVVGEAEWPAVIDAEKWRAVVRALTDPARRTNNGTTAVRSLGSGLFICGVCEEPVRTDRDRQGHRNYRCREGSHVTRLTTAVDELVSGVIVERLRRPDLRNLLHVDRAEDVSGLESRAVELLERRRQLVSLFAEGSVDAVQLTEGTKRLGADLEDVRKRIAAAYSDHALAGIGDSPDPGAAWLDSTLERQRLVLDALVRVRLMPSGRGRPPGWRPGESYFRPETVRIDWR
jgi:DNA invertase Pin-like site-specific DNA recombinase